MFSGEQLRVAYSQTLIFIMMKNENVGVTKEGISTGKYKPALNTEGSVSYLIDRGSIIKYYHIND